jgi:arylsulfatase A-like enzyme
MRHVITLLCLLAVTSMATAAPQPNIVHILADDLGWQDIACYYRAAHGGQESAYETPHLDRIAAQGMRFMQAYSPSATCSPSRAAIMAGQFTPRTGVLHVTGGEVPTPFNASFAYMDGFYPCRLDLNTPTIARVLKDAGYTTAHIKKWHLGGRSDGYPGPLQYGFDFSWDAKTKDYNDPELWDSARKGKSEYYNGLWLPLNPRHKGFATDKPNDPFRTDPGDDDRPFDGVSDLALRWLAKAKDGGKPFFLNLCPSLVHGPISTRDRKRLQHYCDKMGVPFPTAPGKITDKKDGQVNPYYASMIDDLDWSIGEVLTFLETTDDPRNPGQKLIANTWLIISSDNGGAEGNFAPGERVADNSPLREGKSTVYEGGLRIPFIVMAPGVKPGSVSETPVNLIDLFPTFMSIAGAPRRGDLNLDGCDLLPVLLGKETVARHADGRPRDTLYFSLPCGKTASSVIRRNGWKLVLNHTPEANGRPPVELFQLYHDDGRPADLSEQHNLAASRPAERDELLAALEKWLHDLDAQLPYKNATVAKPGNALPGAEKVPRVLGLNEKDDRVEVRFESAGGKSAVIRADLIYTTNGSDELRDRSAYEEWHRIRAEVGDGIAFAAAPPGMTHGIFCLRDENGFLIRSKDIPPSNGPGSVRNFSIASDSKDTFAWRPGLIALIRLAEKARVSADMAKLDTAALSAALASAEITAQQPTDPTSYPIAIRKLRHAIRSLEVPESKTGALHLFDLGKW